MRLALIHNGNDNVLMEYDPAKFAENLRIAVRKRTPFIGPTRREFMKAFDQAWEEIVTDFKRQSVYI